MDIKDKLSIGSLLIARCPDETNRYYRIVDHTQKEVKIAIIIPNGREDETCYVNSSCETVNIDDGKGEDLAITKDETSLIWGGLRLFKYEKDSFDERIDKFPG